MKNLKSPLNHEAFLKGCERILRQTYTRVAHSTESIRTGKDRVDESLDAVQRSRRLLESDGVPSNHYEVIELGLRPHNGTRLGETRAPGRPGITALAAQSGNDTHQSPVR